MSAEKDVGMISAFNISFAIGYTIFMLSAILLIRALAFRSLNKINPDIDLI